MSTESSPKLTTAFNALGILAILTYFGGVAIKILSDYSAKINVATGLKSLSYTSNSSVEAAHATLTNRNGIPAVACLKGVVSSATTGTKVESHVVCTGEIKPYSTVAIDAPYRVGSVLEICNKQGFGDNKLVDWSKCTFEMIDMTNTVKQLFV